MNSASFKLVRGKLKQLIRSVFPEGRRSSTAAAHDKFFRLGARRQLTITAPVRYDLQEVDVFGRRPLIYPSLSKDNHAATPNWSQHYQNGLHKIRKLFHSEKFRFVFHRIFIDQGMETIWKYGTSIHIQRCRYGVELLEVAETNSIFEIA